MIRYWALPWDQFMPSEVVKMCNDGKKRRWAVHSNGSITHFRVCFYRTPDSEPCCKLVDCDRMPMWCNTRCWRYKQQGCTCKVFAKKAFTLLCYYHYCLVHLYLDFLQKLIKIIAGKEGYICIMCIPLMGNCLACLLHKILVIYCLWITKLVYLRH